MFQIIMAQSKHLDQLMKLEQKVFPTNQISIRSMRRFIDLKKVLVILKFNKVIGSMIVLVNKGSTKARIYSLAIDPDHQGQGLGNQFIDRIPELSHKITEIILEVREDNHKAIAFYKHQGFVDYGEYKSYYEDQCTAIKMRKQIIYPL